VRDIRVNWNGERLITPSDSNNLKQKGRNLNRFGEGTPKGNINLDMNRIKG